MGCKSSKKEQVTENPTTKPSDDPEASTMYGEKLSKIHEHKFTEVKFGDEENSILLTRIGKKIVAVGGKCPHGGTPLVDAPIQHGRVRCVAHGACFDLETGDIEDFPGFDCLPIYDVEVGVLNAYIKVNPKNMPLGVMRPMTRLSDQSLRLVIIGSGAAGYSCAQTLREEGYTGRIIMVTDEKYLPYDRTKLTKSLDCNFDSTKIRGATFYQDNDIEVLLNRRVSEINVKTHFIYFEGYTQPQLMYDNLFIAVGLKPRFYAPTVRGTDLRNMHVLRTLDDYDKICKKADGKDVVIVGSSFISIELAELLSPIARSVHILSRSKYPYGPVFGQLTAGALLDHLLSHLLNVTFHATDEVRHFLGNRSGEVTAVYTVKKQTIGAQLVVVGIGALPNTEFLEQTGIVLNPVDHSIVVNKYMETSLPQVFAGGDVASFPFYLSCRDRAVVCHWQMACFHGKVAALNILGREISIEDVVPSFWTHVCGINVRYLGYGEGYDETIIYGNVDELCFCSVYRRRRRLIAVCCVGCDHLAAELCLLLETDKEWIMEIPEIISKKFPKPPTSSETYHVLKYETHTHKHDADVFKVAPVPMEPFEVELRNRRLLRAQLVPIGYDVVVHTHEEEDPDKALALEIHNMRRDQQDRRKAERLRYGKYKGNVEKQKQPKQTN